MKDPGEILADTPIFRGSSPADFSDLARHLSTRSFAKNAYVFRDGDPADLMYVLLSGEVEVSRTGPDGEEYIVETYVAGDAMGQLPFFDVAPVRVADARALQLTEALCVPRVPLLRHLEGHPTVMLRMLGTYSRWIRQRDLNISQMAFQNLTGRVASKLIELVDVYGEPAPGGWVIARDLKQQELAAMVGASRENVNRALRRLESIGDVGRKGTRIFLPDIDALRERYSWATPSEWEESRAVDRRH